MSMKSAPAVDGRRPRGSSQIAAGAEKTEGLPETFLALPFFRLRHRVSTDADAVTGRRTRGRRTGEMSFSGSSSFNLFFSRIFSNLYKGSFDDMLANSASLTESSSLNRMEGTKRMGPSPLMDRNILLSSSSLGCKNR